MARPALRATTLIAATVVCCLRVSPSLAQDSETTRMDAIEKQIRALQDELKHMRAEITRRDAAVRAAQQEAAAAHAEAAHAEAARAAAAPPLVTTVQPPAAAVAQAPAPPPGPPLKHGQFQLGGLTITLGGYIEAAGIFRSLNETSDISSTFSGIPLANTPQGHETELRFTARQSRFAAGVEGHPDDVTTIGGYGEIDLQGAAPTANSNESNSYTPRLRVAYATYDRKDWGVGFIGGQDWSLLTLNQHGITPREEQIPLSIDGQYVVGFTWSRQPQFRVVKSLIEDKLAVGLSVENPQTVFTTGGFTTSTFGTANLVTLPTGQFVNINNAGGTGFAPTVNYSDEVAPDVVAKLAWDPGWGHYEVNGIARFLHDRVDFVGGGHGATTPAGGIGAGTILPLIPGALTFQGSVLAGYGIGRYGAGQLPDATIRPNGSPWPIPEVQALLGLIGHPIPTIDLYAYFGTEQESKTAFIEGGKGYGYGSQLFVNSGCDIELSPLTCTGNTSGLTEGTVGVWWRFLQGNFGMMALGAQYAYIRRNTFPGIGGEPTANENIMMVSFRYYPFQ